MAAPRTYQERKTHALELLGAPEADAWIATASADGVAYMVPLSIGWTSDEHIVLVTLTDSPTGRNLTRQGVVRVGLGGTRDVVMVEAEVVGRHAVADTPAAQFAAFVDQSGWDPSAGSDADRYTVYSLRPITLQAWREANEIAGRTLMKDGAWLGAVSP